MIVTLVIIGLILSPIVGVTVIALANSNKTEKLSSGALKKALGSVPRGMRFEFKDSGTSGRKDIFLYDRDNNKLAHSWDVPIANTKEIVRKLVSDNLHKIKYVIDDIPLMTYVVPSDVMKEATVEDGELVFAEERKFHLPRLPYGLTWKVSRDEGSPVLQLLQKRKNRKARVLEEEVLLETDDNAKELLRVSYSVLQEADRKHAKIDIYYVQPKTAFSEFEGEY